MTDPIAVASNTATVDFVVRQVPLDATADDMTVSVMSWEGLDSTDRPGLFSAQMLGVGSPVPAIDWCEEDGTQLSSFFPELNQWYTAQFDWGWDTLNVYVYKRGDAVADHVFYYPASSTPTPQAYCKAFCGFFGNDVATFELSLDNASAQVHCSDIRPGPPSGDYELVYFPTSMTSEGSADGRHSPFTVGTASVALSDGDDATYGWVTWLRSVKGIYPLWTAVDPSSHTFERVSGDPIDFSLDSIDPAWITEIGTRFRAKSTEDGAVVAPALFGNVSKLLTFPSYTATPHTITIATGGVWDDYEYFFNSDEYSVSGWAPDGMQSALDITSYLYTRTQTLNPSDISLGGDFNVQVSEQCLVMRFTIP